MLKFLSALPVMALVSVLLLRSMGNPARSPAAKPSPQSTPDPAIDFTPDDTATSPYLSFARTTFEEGTRAIVNARAIALFQTAQKQGKAQEWIDKYCRSVAGDVAVLRTKYGTITGTAEQFTEFLNRTSELSACSAAQDWIINGQPTGLSASVNPEQILSQYGGVYGKQK